MKSLSGEFIYSMDKEHDPVLRIDPGETVAVDTLDAFGDQINDESSTLADIDMDKINPATGPIYVNSADPGDALVVDVKKIEVKSPGVQGIVPGFGFLSERFDESVATLHKITEDNVGFKDLELPKKPMIGTIGVAPEGEGVPCNTPGRHGGNMDTPDVREGARLYLPVFQEGALFSLGDAHALQGDGEVCGVGIEVGTTTTLEKRIRTPMIETEEEFMTVGNAEELEEAGKEALEAMIDHLEKETELTPREAYKLCSVACNLKISQVVNPKKTVRASIDKSIL